MTLPDLLGYTFSTIMLGGLLWGLIDLLSRIQKQPRQAINVLRMSPYPFVPDDEPAVQPREGRMDGPGGLRLSPVPVETRSQALR